MDFTKSKEFCSAKDPIKNTKGKTSYWEKRFPYHISYRGPISSVYIYKIENDETTKSQQGYRETMSRGLKGSMRMSHQVGKINKEITL